jgi:hypothetical protein
LLATAHRVLSTSDAEDYLTIVMAFFVQVAAATRLVDVNIAAGVAAQDLEEFRTRLLADDGQVSGKANLHVLKPI